MRYILIAIALLVASVPVSAQTNTVPAGQVFNVAFDHNGQDVTGFQCYVDGKAVGDLLAVTARRCVIPGQSAGTHAVTVEAINSSAKAMSAPLTATAVTPPPTPQPPTNLRIEIQVAVSPTGGVTLLQAKAERVP